MSVVRGRPPGLGRGIIGSIRRYWSSLSAWPAPKSPTNTRSAGLHILVSRKDRSSSPTATSGGGAHFTRSQPPLSKRAVSGFHRQLLRSFGQRPGHHAYGMAVLRIVDAEHTVHQFIEAAPMILL